MSCFSCRGASGLISFPHVQRVRRAFGSCHCGLHRERGERAFFLQAQQMMPPPKPSTLVTSKSGNRCALLISHTRLSCPRKSIQHMKTSNRQCTTLMQTYRMLPVQSANFAGPRYCIYQLAGNIAQPCLMFCPYSNPSARGEPCYPVRDCLKRASPHLYCSLIGREKLSTPMNNNFCLSGAGLCEGRERCWGIRGTRPVIGSAREAEQSGRRLCGGAEDGVSRGTGCHGAHHCHGPRQVQLWDSPCVAKPTNSPQWPAT